MRCVDGDSADTTWLDSMPEIYDRCLGPVLFAPYARHVAERATRFAPRTVLELAAGTGIVTAELVRALPDAAVTATDLNPAMVSWGADHVPGATWLVADAQHLDLPEAAFDLVVCQFGAMFFPDRRAAYAEAARVLRPGGTLLFSTWDTAESSPFPAALLNAVRSLFPDDPPDFLGRVPHGYHDADALRRDVESVGMTVDSLEHTSLPGAAPSADVLAEGYCLGSPLRFELDRRGDLDQLHAAVAARMTEELGTGPVTGLLTALVVTATRA
jgi:SAM-dependent methyltransferase